jgi:hypothetical protein
MRKPSAPPLVPEARVVDLQSEVEDIKEMMVREIREEVERGKDELSVSRLRSRIERAVQRETEKRVRNDPEIREMVRDYKEELRIAVVRAAQRALEEIVDEDRYHRVNRAFLNSLRRRADKLVAGAHESLSSKVNFSYLTSILALLLSMYSTYRVSRL